MVGDLDALVAHLEGLVGEFRAAQRQVRALDDNFRCEACEACRRCRFCTTCARCDECTYCEHCDDCARCTRCRACVGCSDSTQLEHCDACERSQHLVLCLACVDCSHCIACVGLSGEEFCVLNQRLSRQDFFKVAAALRGHLDAGGLGGRTPLTAAATGASSPPSPPRFTVDALQRIRARVKGAGRDLSALGIPSLTPTELASLADEDAWAPEAAAAVLRSEDEPTVPVPPTYAVITWPAADPPPKLLQGPPAPYVEPEAAE
jgi:hypothetical protein